MNKAFIVLLFTLAILEVIHSKPLRAIDVHSALQIGTFDSSSATGKTVYTLKKNVCTIIIYRYYFDVSHYYLFFYY